MSKSGDAQSTAPTTEPSALQPAGSDSGAASTETAESAQPPTAKGRSPLLAALLSFVWPGLGQLYARRRIEAAIFAFPALIVAVWLLTQLSQGVWMFGASLLDDSYALFVVIVVIFIGAWRLISVFHAYAVAAHRRRPRILDSGLLAVLLVTVLVTHGVALTYAWSFYTFDRVVPSNDFMGNAPTDDPSIDPEEQFTAAPTLTPTLISRTPVLTYASPVPTPVITPKPPPSRRVTILFTGIDWMTGRSHALMDSLLVVSLDVKSRKVAIVSVPRDSANYEFYWGGNAGINTKINNFYNLVWSGKIHAPDPPLTALTKEIGWLVGVKIDYYAIIDLHAFRVMVDVVGGVCVTNPKAINDPSTGTFIPAGYQCMDGPTTLKYVRSREGAGDNDYTRSSRQQDVLVALEQKLATPEGLLRLPDLLGLAGTSIQTNFPLKTVKSYVSIAQMLTSKDISKCVLGPPYNFHPDTSTTKGTWTSRLKMNMVANLSVRLFGKDSRFYGMEGITPQPCRS
jgi:LCP family protein required for cell wall assembly